MRLALVAVALVMAVAPGAHAEQINLLSPPMITNAGLKEINARYTGKTGVTFKMAGAEITRLVGTSAWYAPGSAAAEMVEIILKDKKKIVPCSVFLQGEYGINNLFVGVPVKLGARGVEQIIQIKLTAEEDAALKKSAAAVKELTEVIKV